MTREGIGGAHRRHHTQFLAAGSTGAVVLAAGRGLRFGCGVKPLAPLAGRPILDWALKSVAANRSIRHVVVTAPAEAIDSFRDLVAGLDLHLPVQVIEGGTTRQRSARKGLEALPGPLAWAAITDAARPLQPPGLLDRLVSEVAASEPISGPRAEVVVGVLPALPLSDTIHYVREGGLWAQTPNRDRLRAAQTPQVACWACLLAAHREAELAGVDLTDDAAVLGWAGADVLLVPGDPANLKITCPGDLIIAEAYVAEQWQNKRKAMGLS